MSPTPISENRVDQQQRIAGPPGNGEMRGHRTIWIPITENAKSRGVQNKNNNTIFISRRATDAQCPMANGHSFGIH